MKVIGYIRVSTQGQARDGYSLAYQEDEIKAYCQDQECRFFTCLKTRVMGLSEQGNVISGKKWTFREVGHYY